MKLAINGMHCKSCELLVKNKIEAISGVTEVKVDLKNSEAIVEHDSQTNLLEEINRSINPFGYQAKLTTDRSVTERKKPINSRKLVMLVIGFLFLIIIYTCLDPRALPLDLDLTNPGAYILLGFVASISSCGALVGGLILTLSQKSSAKQLLVFMTGRLLSFFILGGLLGWLGRSLLLPLDAMVVIIILASVIMIIAGLELFTGLSIKPLLKLPLTDRILGKPLNNPASKSIYSLLIGMATFFIPCGFTLTAQAQALASGNFLAGAIVMTSFVLGTTPILLLIGLGSKYILVEDRSKKIIQQLIGVILITLAILTIKNQLSLLGL